MNRELYDRQDMLPLHIPQSAMVIGAGGVGAWAAIFLAMSGVPELRLFDSDHVELSNLARLPFPEAIIGQSKTEVLREYLEYIRLEVHVETYPNAEEYTLNAAKSVVLFDCTDRQQVQLMLQAWCKREDVQYVRSGYDGTHITVTDNVPSWTTEADTGGYARQASWVVPAAVAAALAVSHALYQPQEISCDLNELGRTIK